MIITLIAAHDPNLVIGADGKLPWHYPEDLKHFKKHTLGQTIIMGRGVFEELGEKPLPGRTNIVLSRSRTYEQVTTHRSLDDALNNVDLNEVFIIGGGVLYRNALPKADRLLITKIKKKYPGDTYFPEYRDKIGIDWVEIDREDHTEFSFIEYIKATSYSNLN
jgi:dihydrofolate reductase